VKATWTLFPLSTLIVGALTVSAAEDGTALTKEELAATLPGVEAREIYDSPIPGMFEVAVGSNIAYVSEDGRYFIQGDMYDLDENENLTERRRARARVDVLAGVDPDTMIVFSPAPEDVKHTVTIFTDIDCGYCRQFHREIAKVNELGIRVQYLSFPRTGPDTDSWFKADRVWCAADANAALTQAKLGGQFSEAVCETAPVANHYDLGQLVGVRGTPTVFSETGVQLGGYLPPDELLARLESYDATPE